MKKINNEASAITVTKDDGTQVEAKLLFTFELSGDEFVLYELEESVYAARLNDDFSLAPVHDDEWELIEKVYNEYLENAGEFAEDFEEEFTNGAAQFDDEDEEPQA